MGSRKRGLTLFCKTCLVTKVRKDARLKIIFALLAAELSYVYAFNQISLQNLLFGIGATAGGTILNQTTSITTGIMNLAHTTTIGDYSQSISDAVASSESEDPALTLSDTFSTNTAWTQVGTGITVNSGAAGKLASVGAESSNARVYRSIGETLNDTLWIAEFDAKFTNVTGTDNDDELIFRFSAGTLAYSSPSVNQDAIGIMFQNSGTPTAYVEYKDGTATAVRGTAIASLTTNTLFYFRLERSSATNIRLSIFSNASRTTHVSGSPINLTIASTVTGLTHIQLSTNNLGDGVSDVEIDNLKIKNNASSIDNLSANYTKDNSTATRLKTSSEVQAKCYWDLGSSVNVSAIALWSHSDTNATQVKIRGSDTTTFTDTGLVRTINISALTHGQYNYIRFNLKTFRYWEIIVTDATAKVLSINEIKFYAVTSEYRDANHGHTLIDSSSTTIGLDGT